MKTFLKIFSISTLLMNTTILTIACRPDTLGEIWIITDGGDLFDKAFNEQVYQGANNFVTKFNLHRDEISINKGFEVWKNREMHLKWIIAKDTDISTLYSYYQMAGYAGAKTVITIGFGHVKALEDTALQTMYKNLGIKFILVDAPLANYINTASLIYASEQSSFLAGLAGAMWLVANNPDKPELKMSTFGGQALDTVVTIMLGYYWGVQYYNLFKDQGVIKNMVQQLNPSIDTSRLPQITFDDSMGENQFTDGFQSGTNQARTITEILVKQNKNDIVFPVAGGQVSDLINAITNYNQKAKLIGVDVDQSKQYPAAKDYFLTSSLKGLKPSTEWMLWNSFNLNQNNFTYNPLNEGYFNGQINENPLKEHEFLGITNSEPIEDIFDALNANTFWNQANKVSEVIADLNHDYELQNHPSNFWRNAWKNHEQNSPTFDE